MVRRGWSRLLVAAAVVTLGGVAACTGGDGSGDDTGGTPTTGLPVAATLPPATEVAAGSGWLVLDGAGFVLEVRSCVLEPVTDPETGVTTDLTIDADDGLGTAVLITRSTTQGDVATVTDTVAVVHDDGELMEANRADVNGRYIDLLAEGALQPLLGVEGDLVTAAGVFGPRGARPGDPGLVEGSLIVRCPPAG